MAYTVMEWPPYANRIFVNPATARHMVIRSLLAGDINPVILGLMIQ